MIPRRQSWCLEFSKQIEGAESTGENLKVPDPKNTL